MKIKVKTSRIDKEELRTAAEDFYFHGRTLGFSCAEVRQAFFDAVFADTYAWEYRDAAQKLKRSPNA